MFSYLSHKFSQKISLAHIFLHRPATLWGLLCPLPGLGIQRHGGFPFMVTESSVLLGIYTHMFSLTSEESNILRKRKVKVKSFSHVQLSATPWIVAHQAPPFMIFSRQEYWSALPFPSPGDLLYPGIEPRSPALQADTLPSKPPGKPPRSCQINGTINRSWENVPYLKTSTDLPSNQLSAKISSLVGCIGSNNSRSF